MTTERMDVLTLSSGVQALRAIPKRMRIAAGVGVDQDLVSVESLPGGVKRAIDTVRVVHARFQTAHKGVPEMEGLVYIGIEPNRLEWLERVVG